MIQVQMENDQPPSTLECDTSPSLLNTQPVKATTESRRLTRAQRKKVEEQGFVVLETVEKDSGILAGKKGKRGQQHRNHVSKDQQSRDSLLALMTVLETQEDQPEAKEICEKSKSTHPSPESAVKSTRASLNSSITTSTPLSAVPEQSAAVEDEATTTVNETGKSNVSSSPSTTTIAAATHLLSPTVSTPSDGPNNTSITDGSPLTMMAQWHKKMISITKGLTGLIYSSETNNSQESGNSRRSSSNNVAVNEATALDCPPEPLPLPCVPDDVSSSPNITEENISSASTTATAPLTTDPSTLCTPVFQPQASPHAFVQASPTYPKATPVCSSSSCANSSSSSAPHSSHVSFLVGTDTPLLEIPSPLLSLPPSASPLTIISSPSGLLTAISASQAKGTTTSSTTLIMSNHDTSPSTTSVEKVSSAIGPSKRPLTSSSFVPSAGATIVVSSGGKRQVQIARRSSARMSTNAMLEKEQGKMREKSMIHGVNGPPYKGEENGRNSTTISTTTALKSSYRSNIPLRPLNASSMTNGRGNLGHSKGAITHATTRHGLGARLSSSSTTFNASISTDNMNAHNSVPASRIAKPVLPTGSKYTANRSTISRGRNVVENESTSSSSTSLQLGGKLRPIATPHPKKRSQSLTQSLSLTHPAPCNTDDATTTRLLGLPTTTNAAKSTTYTTSSTTATPAPKRNYLRKGSRAGTAVYPILSTVNTVTNPRNKAYSGAAAPGTISRSGKKVLSRVINSANSNASVAVPLALLSKRKSPTRAKEEALRAIAKGTGRERREQMMKAKTPGKVGPAKNIPKSSIAGGVDGDDHHNNTTTSTTTTTSSSSNNNNNNTVSNNPGRPNLSLAERSRLRREALILKNRSKALGSINNQTLVTGTTTNHTTGAGVATAAAQQVNRSLASSNRIQATSATPFPRRALKKTPGHVQEICNTMASTCTSSTSNISISRKGVFGNLRVNVHTASTAGNNPISSTSTRNSNISRNVLLKSTMKTVSTISRRSPVAAVLRNAIKVMTPLEAAKLQITSEYSNRSGGPIAKRTVSRVALARGTSESQIESKSSSNPAGSSTTGDATSTTTRPTSTCTQEYKGEDKGENRLATQQNKTQTSTQSRYQRQPQQPLPRTIRPQTARLPSTTSSCNPLNRPRSAIASTTTTSTSPLVASSLGDLPLPSPSDLRLWRVTPKPSPLQSFIASVITTLASPASSSTATLSSASATSLSWSAFTLLSNDPRKLSITLRRVEAILHKSPQAKLQFIWTLAKSLKLLGSAPLSTGGASNQLSVPSTTNATSSNTDDIGTSSMSDGPMKNNVDTTNPATSSSETVSDNLFPLEVSKAFARGDNSSKALALWLKGLLLKRMTA